MVRLRNINNKAMTRTEKGVTRVLQSRIKTSMDTSESQV